MKALLVGSAVLALLALTLSSPARAEWTSVALTVYGYPYTLTLTPSHTGSGPFIYEYDLANPRTGVEEIIGFGLTLPAAVLVSSLTDISHPPGWVLYLQLSANQVLWFAEGPGLIPGQTAVFEFTSASGPSITPVLWASGQGALGYSARTYGPIPEPSSALGLMAGLIAIAGMRLRRLRLRQ
jgi:hypothetical protein